MKRFIISILCISVFFIGLGSLVENAGARFKSDEKALDLIRKARQAIGGDAAVANVRSMTITGKSTHTFKINGEERTEQGETEIALQLPDKLMKMIKIGHDDGTGNGEKTVSRQVDVVVVGKGEGGGSGIGAEPGGKTIIIKKGDGTTEELKTDGEKTVTISKNGDKTVWNTESGEKIKLDGKHVIVDETTAKEHHGKMRQNELLRTTLGLLLSAPEGLDVEYIFAGEANIDGTACNIVEARFGGSAIKLYLGQSSNLPVMMSYEGMRMPKMIRFNKELPPPADGEKDNVVFMKRSHEPGEMAEFQVKFSDYRSVGGVSFPYRWTTSVNGKSDEVFDVTNYEINPANIAEKFKNQKLMVRTKTPQQQ